MAATDSAVKEAPAADELGAEDVHDRGRFIVILYNDDYHDMLEVVSQLQKATGYDAARCGRIMLEAHTRGRAVAFAGTEEKCDKVAAVLRQIRLQVETDRA
ncbi:MAG TPA: ATP-dependent Clp protease adaptor ClpS [Chthonomonadales bacterium]|nr:ATP-dependent Clp protease adaptor ClpS [Chthonomonadales bacterium]